MANIKLNNVRTSYCYLLEPNKFGEGEKYTSQFIIEKTDKQCVKIARKVIEVAKEKWPTPFAKLEPESIKTIEDVLEIKWPKGYRNPLHDGDEEQTESLQYDSVYKGNMYISGTSKNRPQLFDRAVNALGNGMSEGEAVSYFYSGAMVNASLSVYAYEKGVNKGVSFGISGVQFKCHNERLGGADCTNDFEAEEDEDSDDDLI